MQHQDGSFHSALTERKGVDGVQSINPALRDFVATGSSEMTADDYVQGILSGNRNVLAKAITLVESTKENDKILSQEILKKLSPLAGKSVRVGITGVPGAGKSTLIEILGVDLLEKGHKVAVLAVDPSSERSKGSILGDKTRMEKLAAADNAFVRPSPSSGSLGGVARNTSETILLCETAGFDVILVETVGVGQSETLVRNMVDFFLLVQIANAGDELQGIKRGVMEMADMILVNKADGNNVTASELAAAQIRNAIHLFMPPQSGFAVEVMTCSAVSGFNITKIWENIHHFIDFTKKTGFFEKQRKEQIEKLFYQTLNNRILENYHQKIDNQKMINQTLKTIWSGKNSLFAAVSGLFSDKL
ncbi:ATPase/protein kinase [Bacteroidia bacterium]|nr:ATPase/protein kinase [Bacteroidia bacterium]